MPRNCLLVLVEGGSPQSLCVCGFSYLIISVMVMVEVKHGGEIGEDDNLGDFQIFRRLFYNFHFFCHVLFFLTKQTIKTQS